MKKIGRIIKISLLSFFGLIFLTLIISSIILYGRVSSMMSIKKKGDNLYTMNYKKNYHLDKALKANIKSTDELFKFICDEMFFGYQIDINTSRYACSAFTTTTPDGNHIVGRNFDLPGSNTLSVYTNPKKGYSSVSTVLADTIGVDGYDIEATSLKGRILLLAAPYLAVDGMNEKGLSASLLDMDNIGETHMYSDKPDLIVTMAVRLLLDKAANVDEAISLLEKYDIHSAHGETQHIFLSDASGSYAIVEWYKNKMYVVKYPVCTNFRLSNPNLDGDYSGQCGRFDILDNSLKEKSTNSIDESFKMLESVKQDGKGSHTIWSVIFNLNDFTVDYVVNMDYDNSYHLNPKKY
ncbi:MAG: linear amide C-N hydrolase [bacterium]|nr:linear amide C-N hydrolase [bacterium]